MDGTLIITIFFLAVSCLDLVRTRMLLPALSAALAEQTGCWYLPASSRECDLAVVVLKKHQAEERQCERQLLQTNQ